MTISARFAMSLGVSLCLSPGGFAIAAAQPEGGLEPLEHAICRLIDNSARADHLPAAFLTRIIWRESGFRATALSPAGAQGIAQFMPQTARERGLADPFDPEQAIPKAARLLADLRQEFGNLGIAAAAYNAGPARVISWLRGEGGLPAETWVYVRLVTGRDPAEWAGEGREPGSRRSSEADAADTCLAVTAELRQNRGDDIDDGVGFAPIAPWGVQLAANFSKALALAAVERARRRDVAVIGELQPMIIGRVLRSRGTRRLYQIRLPAATREAAAALCGRIRSVGGNCVAMRS